MKNVTLIFATFLLSIISLSGQDINNTFFDKTDGLLKRHVKMGMVDYQAIKNDADFKGLISQIETASFEGLDDVTRKAYLINAYNLLVINGVVKNKLKQSVQDKSGFFENKLHKLAGKKTSLNGLEKNLLLKKYNDPRFHFVLVCGAKGCPPITNFAYRPEKLDTQLDTQTRKAINDPLFTRVNKNDKKIGLSQIFKWYTSDFGGSNKSIIKFINKYRTNKVSESSSLYYYNYDWSLNTLVKSGANVTGGNNSSRYVVSAAIPKGQTETKVFNNLYTQRTRSNPEGNLDGRSNFFTSSLSFLYGFTGKFNAGFDLRYRRVSNTAADVGALNVLTNKADSRRAGFTSFGPKIRWAPVERWSNFSIQSAFLFPIGNDLTGTDTKPYIDWDGAFFNTQLFNDFSIGSNFSIFTELDFLLEDIGKESDGNINRFSTPFTTIFSHFPNAKTTLYALGSYSPYWQEEFDYFAQAGLGAKYQITSNFEVEALYTGFTNKFLSENEGRAATFNLGVRITR